MFPPVEIMDTTLRDGEQTSGVSFNAREKLSIARLLLEELHVSRIEIASARVSQGEQQAVRAIAEWAAAKGYADRVEALGFIDGGVSLDWLGTAGCRVVNLLAKGSRKHCEGQLRRTPERHLEDVRAEILAAVDRGMKVNLYLEDWSNGMRRSPDYVYAMLDGLADAPSAGSCAPIRWASLTPTTPNVSAATWWSVIRRCVSISTPTTTTTSPWPTPPPPCVRVSTAFTSP